MTPAKFPEITLIIPVYNSAETLEGCFESVYNSDYPKESMRIMLVNNRSSDNSFEVFFVSGKVSDTAAAVDERKTG